MGLVADPVSGLRRGRAVIAQAVGLDDEAEVGPVEVDLEAVDDLFGERGRQAGRGGERAEKDLQVRVREAEGFGGQQRSEGADSRFPPLVLERVSQFRGVDQVALIGFVHGALQRPRCQAGGEIEQGAHDRGGRDPVPGRTLGRLQRRPASHAKRDSLHTLRATAFAPSPMEPPRDAHLYRRAGLGRDSPERAGAAMAEHRALAAAQDRRHPPPLGRQLRPADGIDAANDRVQPSTGNPVDDALMREPQRKQLTPRHESLLLFGERPRLAAR